MRCPHCNKKIGLLSKISEWDSKYGEAVILDATHPSLRFDIYCSHCHHMTIEVNIKKKESIDDFESEEEVIFKIPKWLEDFLKL